MFESATIKPAAVQVESHPYLPQTEILDFCSKNGIVMLAFAPLGHGMKPGVLEDPVIAAIAKRVNQTPAQVLLAWAVQRGTAVLTTPKTPARAKENFNISALPEDAMAEINAIQTRQKFNLVTATGIPGIHRERQVTGDPEPSCEGDPVDGEEVRATMSVGRSEDFHSPPELRQDLRNHARGELIGEAFLQAVPVEKQVAIVQAQQVQNGGVEIVDAHAILHGLESDVVGGAVDGAALGAAAGHPDAEAAGTVVAAGLALTLGDRQAPEFPAPDDQRGIQESALLQILDERGHGLVGLAAGVLQARLQVAVGVEDLAFDI